MKHKTSKKKITILTVSFLVILLGFGTFKGYQSFRHDQHQTAEDMDSMMELFNMQLRVPNEEKPDGWIYLQLFDLPNNRYDSPFDIKTFFNYMLKKVTFQKIEYKDVEPQWSLLPKQTNPPYSNPRGTAERLKNFNENLLYNPKYEQYCSDLDFKKPLTMDDLLNRPQKAMELIHDLLDYARNDGLPFDDLADTPCPLQYLPK